MHRLRLLLIPFGATAELLLLALCWAISLINRDWAAWLITWAKRVLPDARLVERRLEGDEI